MFFRLSTWELWLLVAAAVLGFVAAGYLAGRFLRWQAMHGRGATTVVLAGVLVTVLLLVIFDLDRPTRGVIRVPDTPLVALRAAMQPPPAAEGPSP